MEFDKFENANAILNGMDDCHPDFTKSFVELHQKPIDNFYCYEWFLRSVIDVIKINHSVLYVACGTAGYSRLFKNIKRFVGIDFSKNMVNAAQKLHKDKKESYAFHCCTLEEFQTKESYDLIYLGPYGHNVPYTYDALNKAKKLLNKDGMIFCTICVQKFNFYTAIKETIKQLLYNKNIYYNPMSRLENMLVKSDLNIFVKIIMKTSIGYAACYVVKNNTQ